MNPCKFEHWNDTSEHLTDDPILTQTWHFYTPNWCFWTLKRHFWTPNWCFNSEHKHDTLVYQTDASEHS